mmetsp:Transcript_24059/g.61250  ORF Transcript_24059/g.61250 Transcript_24059/m.61250 type:complete len:345 (-) Transcript_24059:16-1050(-)
MTSISSMWPKDGAGHSVAPRATEQHRATSPASHTRHAPAHTTSQTRASHKHMPHTSLLNPELPPSTPGAPGHARTPGCVCMPSHTPSSPPPNAHPLHPYTCSTPARAAHSESARIHTASPPLRPRPTMRPSSTYAYRKKGSLPRSLASRAARSRSALSGTHARQGPSPMYILSTSKLSLLPSSAMGPLKVRCARLPRNTPFSKLPSRPSNFWHAASGKEVTEPAPGFFCAATTSLAAAVNIRRQCTPGAEMMSAHAGLGFTRIFSSLSMASRVLLAVIVPGKMHALLMADTSSSTSGPVSCTILADCSANLRLILHCGLRSLLPNEACLEEVCCAQCNEHCMIA